MIRVLHVLAYKPIGGVGALLLNLVATNKNEDALLDFVMYESHNNSNFISEVENNGCKAYILKPQLKIKNFFSVIISFYKFMSQHNYDIVELHSPNLGLIIWPIAIIKGIKHRIVHAHSMSYSDTKLKSLRNFIIIKLSSIFVTERFACSQKTGEFWFGKQDFYVVKNGINVSKFKYNIATRTRIRESLNIKDKIVIGHVGNFLPVKNHKFIIKIFYEFQKVSGATGTLVLVGDGPLRRDIERYAEELSISSDSIKFLGRRDDVNNLLQGFDVLLLPSFSEGFPVSIIEAQATGLPCFVSTNVTCEISIVANIIKYISLSSSPDIWASKIYSFLREFQRKDMSPFIKEKGYDTINVSTALLTKYIEITGH